ncbi:MAG: hypothetical protein ACFHXK_15970 [bacterium]
MSATAHTKRYRPLLFLVAAALLVQSLYPSGTMPGQLGNGWVATLCPEGMPVAFMAQLQARFDSSSKPFDLHAGHHGTGTGTHHGSPHSAHAQSGELDAHADHSAAHQAMGDCQLGSQLDQPFTLTSSYTPGLAVQVELADAPFRITDLSAGEVYRQRPRGPPLSC